MDKKVGLNSRAPFVPALKIIRLLGLVLALSVSGWLPAAAQVVNDSDLPGAMANLETIPAGSLVIPMDNTYQALSGTPFNLSAYGLVSALLHTNIPVKWAIAAGKAKDGIDFTANAARILPTNAAAANLSFRSGPFVITPDWTNRALPIITAFGKKVAVYRLTANTTVDVRYTLGHKPQVAVLDDGGTDKIHTSILEEAGFPADHYSVLHAADVQFLPVASCFTIVTSPHFDGGLTASNQTRSIREFVLDGGNFLAQCAAVRTYENNTFHGHFHSSQGFVDDNKARTFRYPNADMPFNQFQGNITDQGGSLQDWTLATGSTFTNNAFAQITDATRANVFRAGVSKLTRGRPGSVVFYLGGHSYSGSAITDYNGRRAYLNALFVPPDRPGDCLINFQTDLAICKTDGLTTVTNGQRITYTIVATNRGPGRVTGATVKDRFPASLLNATWTSATTGGATNLNPSGAGDINAMVNIPIHGSVIFTAQATVGASTASMLTNCASITLPPNMSDANPSNNFAADVDRVLIPVVIVDPPTDQTNCPGNNVTFGVVALGTDLTYQWYRETTPLLKQTNNTLLLTNTRTEDAGNYCVVVTGAAGGPITNCAKLVVNEKVIVITPPTDQTVCQNSTAQFIVGAVGTGLTYEWYFGNTLLIDQTTSTLLLDNVGLETAGTYTVIVRGACAPAVTNRVTLRVNQNTQIISAPTSQTSVVGSNAIFNVVATGTGLTYQWYFKNVLISTNPTLTLNNLTTNQAGTYCLVVSSACGNPITNCIPLIIDNRRPLAADDSYTVAEDTTLTIAIPGVLANDRDPDGDALSATRVSDPLHGTLTLNPNGSFTYRPNTNYNGSDSFTYRASDGSLTSSVATVTINVTSGNDVPVANDDSYSMTAGTTLNIVTPGVLANDSDVDGDSLSAVPVKSPTHGALALNANGSFAYTPDTNYSGGDSFTYRASDGRATSAVATVTISIVPVPIVIVRPPTDQTNCPGATAMFNVTATGTALTYQWFFSTNILVGETNSVLTLEKIDALDAGPYCVVVNGAAGGPITNCAALIVNQNVIVTTPPANQTVCQNNTAQFTVGATGTGLTYQWYFGATLLNSQTASTLVLNNVSLSAAGTYRVVVSGACGVPATNSASLTINQNLSIVSPPVGQTSYVGSNVTFGIVATGTSLTYQWLFNGSVISTNSTLTLNSITTNRAGVYCVVVRGVCGSPVTNCVTLTIQNRAPIANNDSYIVSEDSALTVGMPGVLGNDSDPDGDTVRAILMTGPAHGALVLNPDGSFTYRPNTNYYGTDSFTYRANDLQTSSSPATVTITVTPMNDAPVAANDAYSINEDTILTVSAPGVLANDSDVDGDTLAAVLVSNPAHGSLALQPNGAIVYVPKADYNGTDSFTYRASDGSLQSGLATVTITINPVNDAPVSVNDDTYVIAEDATLVVPPRGVLTNDIDVDGDVLTALLVSNTTNGTLMFETNGGFVYVPNPNFNGVDHFTYRATDGRLTSDVARVTITVTPVSDAPTVNDDAYSTREDTLLTIASPGVLANDFDVDGNPLSAVLVSNPAHGTIALNLNGSFAYRPHTNFNGADTFTYRATDGAVTSSVATVTITVLPVNDLPMPGIEGDSYTALEDRTLVVAAPGVLINDTDADNDVLRAVLVDGPSHGTLTLSANGSFTYRPATNYFGDDSFRYVANDGTSNSLPASVSIKVIPVNDAPSFTSGGDQKVNQNAAPQKVANWARNISTGPDNESYQTPNFKVLSDNYSLFSAPPAIAPDGTLTYTPITTASGVANVSVVLRDDGGTANGGVDASGEATFRIVVSGPPTVSIVSPTNGSVYLGPATFTIVANANDPDGTVTNVQFIANSNVIGNVSNAPFYFVWTNVIAGNYALTAVATDNDGLSATSVVVNVTVITNAVVATGPIVLNRQNGLFEQFITVSNRTPELWLNGVRLSIYNMDSTNQVWNPTGTNSGAPYLDKLGAVSPAGTMVFLIQYYVPNPRSVPNPTLVAVPLPYSNPVETPRITRIIPTDTARDNVHFTSQSGHFYFIQSTEDFVRWTTEPAPMQGTGTVIACPQMRDGKKRFYRVLMVP